MTAPRAGVVLHDNERDLVPYRNGVGLVARRAMSRAGYSQPFADHRPVILHLTFRMPRPRTVTRLAPSVKPDLDKMVRAVMDALTRVIYLDDGQVIGIHAGKSYADTRPVGVEVTAQVL